MNSKVAKIIRRFAAIEKLDYTGCKNYFQSQEKKLQDLHLEMMRRVIVKKGGDNMANQKICDRPDRTPIGPDDDYLPLKVKQPDGNWVDVDLCAVCGADFQAFLNQARPTTAAAPAAPVNPDPGVNVPQPNPSESTQPVNGETQPGQ